MALEASVTEVETEELKREIKNTRASLGQKIETLESEVRHTVTDTKAAVTASVEEVKKAFDVKRIIGENPWKTLIVSTAVGVVAGKFLLTPRNREMAASSPLPQRRGGSEPSRTGAALSKVAEYLGPEMNDIKSLAIGTLLSAVRDVVVGALPQSAAPTATQLVNRLVRKAGGEPVAGPVFPRTETKERSSGLH